MANLYASISYDHHARHIHRLGHKHIHTSAQTWEARVDVSLDKDGNCTVQLCPKSGWGGETLWQGNIDKQIKTSGLSS